MGGMGGGGTGAMLAAGGAGVLGGLLWLVSCWLLRAAVPFKAESATL